MKPLEPQSQQQVTELSPSDGRMDDAAPTRPRPITNSFVFELTAASLIVDIHTSVGLETFGNTVRVALEYIADPNDSLSDFACETVMEAVIDQWPGWNINGKENEERVTETAVGQWSSWNMDSKENEAKVSETANGQSSCSSELPSSTANRGKSRVKDLSNWKCQTQKRLRNLGLAYVSRSVMVQRQKMMKPGCGLKCRQRCRDRISPKEREQIFSSF